MKKVTILLPDTVKHRIGGSGGRCREYDMAVNEENVVRFLCEPRDYHEAFLLEPDMVRVLSVEDHPGT
ncbi:MAG TPA: hypothetical protein PKM88_15245 [bacterium]|nr:hypothetical protein [bacterium]